ncbi:UNVERIFIED_CONTAM: hypothetical protein Scaly_2735900 [Sesamum calycinum]|uniref:PGG domain-containing protein n=1 Tax=Sesamum calycinum TaxID=2727403 RepID=A0AAW2J3K4_9LAMI
MSAMASSSVQQQQQHPPLASAINAVHFVPTKLFFEDGSSNYPAWKQQMLCIIQSQGLLGFIDGTNPRRPKPPLMQRRLPSGTQITISGVELILYFLTIQNPTTEEETEDEAEGQDLKDHYLLLYRAALQGNWEAAKQIFDDHPEAMTARIDQAKLTALHIAVGAGRRAIRFVKKLVALMPKDSIAAKDENGCTALIFAAAVDNKEAAVILVNRMPSLLYIQNKFGDFPLQTAALYAQRDMLRYLISVTKDDFGQNPYAGSAGHKLLLYVIDAEFLDIALVLVEKYPALARLKTPDNDSALEKITTKKSVFDSERRFNFWERFISSCVVSMKNILRPQSTNGYDIESNIPQNIQSGATKSIEGRRLLKQQALKLVKCLCKEISSLSFENRSEHVYNLIYQMSDHKHFYSDFTDLNGNSLLHLAAKLAPSHKLNEISGAALQMQREIQWYKEVEKFVHPHSRECLNNDGESPKMVFTEEHKILKKEGEKWMKGTATSCTIAAALIATVMFGAAITVPGGNDNSNGFPMFSESSAFIIFAISDAVSLFTSATSLLMFLAILTSRYAEEDFLYALPKRLIIGLGTLFLSISSMMVAFSATVYLVFARKEAWVLIPGGVLACLPVASFVLLQFPLFLDLVYSTYGPGIFGKQSNRPFY